jgi:hypothetical protein
MDDAARKKILESLSKFPHGIDQLKEMEKMMVRVQRKIDEAFMDEMIKGSSHAQLCIMMLVASPISFVMNAFDLMNKIGMVPNEEFPSFVRVYKNYITPLAFLEGEWDTLPFKEFESKFRDAYNKRGHYGWEIDEEINNGNKL